MLLANEKEGKNALNDNNNYCCCKQFVSFFVDKIFYCVIEILTDAMQAANDIVPCC